MLSERRKRKKKKCPPFFVMKKKVRRLAVLHKGGLPVNRLTSRERTWPLRALSMREKIRKVRTLMTPQGAKNLTSMPVEVLLYIARQKTTEGPPIDRKTGGLPSLVEGEGNWSDLTSSGRRTKRVPSNVAQNGNLVCLYKGGGGKKNHDVFPSWPLKGPNCRPGALGAPAPQRETDPALLEQGEKRPNPYRGASSVEVSQAGRKKRAPWVSCQRGVPARLCRMGVVLGRKETGTFPSLQEGEGGSPMSDHLGEGETAPGAAWEDCPPDRPGTSWQRERKDAP